MTGLPAVTRVQGSGLHQRVGGAKTKEEKTTRRKGGRRKHGEKKFQNEKKVASSGEHFGSNDFGSEGSLRGPSPGTNTDQMNMMGTGVTTTPATEASRG